jgi:hypothetical protein
MASVYVSFDSWAGLRYTELSDAFIYAYGLSQLFIFIDKQMLRLKRFSPLSMLFPALRTTHCHRFIISHRHPGHIVFTKKIFASHLRPIHQNLNEHFTRLSPISPDNENYYALSICKVNF